ncbi:DUF6216 family protein [Aeromonas hydrophila]|uniref:DUF6216 family protein n=1 Tax=Aeromonas TaxID=642 RepID=UPI0030CAE9A9
MSESIFKVVVDIPEWLGSWLTTALGGLTVIIVLYLFFRLRAGSSYGFLNRLYAVLIGGSGFHHEIAEKFWRDQKDVERFNALFNTKAKSLKDIQTFIAWIEKHELELRKFTSLKKWFDLEKRKVKRLKKWQLVTPFIFTILAYFLAIPISTIASTDAALLKFNDEEQWMWLGHTEARSFSLNPFRDRNNDWRINKSICSNKDHDMTNLLQKTQLQQKNINITCKSFSNSEDAKRISQIIGDQKIFWFFAVFLWVYTLLSFMETLRRADTNHVRAYLLNKLKKARLRKQTSTRPTSSQDQT